jgi:hypothetical protein
VNEFTTMSDTLDSLRNNFRLLVEFNDLPDRGKNPVWIMIYGKCVNDIEWILDSGIQYWTSDEQGYIEEVYQMLTEWGKDALQEH